ncbi:MAG TPA: protein translocase subunit SecD [Rhodanobacteraceae bacterium]|nr:protein translocase subunit SecD [Rhodanobacteraceae bacterium]
MSDFPRWKYFVVLIAVVLGIIYALPNIFPPQPAVQISANRDAVVDQALSQKVQDILHKNKLPFESVAKEGGDELLVRFASGAGETQRKAASVLDDALGDKYVVAVNQASTVPDFFKAIGANAMPLGLDLRGGVHFLMQVDQEAGLQKQLQRYLGDVRSVLREKNIRYKSVVTRGKTIVATLRSDADRDRAYEAISAESQDLQIENGASSDGSYPLEITIKPERLRAIAQSTIQQNLGTLRNRINALGVSEPIIQQQGDSRIVVELAGVQDTAKAKKIIGAIATLEYRAGDPDVNPIEAERTGIVPPDDRLYHMRDGRPVVLKKKVIVTGDELADASSGFDQQTGSPKVDVTLNAEGARKMLEFTRQNVGRPMAVVFIEHTPEVKMVDGKQVRSMKVTQEVISYATVQGVFGKQFQTTGLGSPKEASELALLLKAGSLAAPMVIVQERVIGPSLGAANIEKGVQAVLVGLALVLLAAAIYYKLFGLVADIALFFNLVILVAILSLFHATLTMPGIAGIVLTLGMAIDANVLICERVREELRSGSTPLASIRAGYEKAWATILDANVTHLLAALALMTLGSGPIKGFGVTLFVGILTSMFTSVTLTHAVTALIHSGRRKLKTLSV